MIKLLCVLVLSGISLSDACQCINIDKEVAYCESKFAGFIKIQSAGYDCEEIKKCYKIAVIEQIKGAKIAPTPTILRTNRDSAACGVRFDKDDKYFVTTNTIDSNALTLNSCQLREKWTSKSPSEIERNIQGYRGIDCPKKQ